ncbi:ABC transporter substrate-binding protein [Frigidibacter sp. ROC022]|uniref:ABC transporter substrate-binding protein n=1 Tax=Frigidibacter sp. ROC022 TaxID=2971796 RepID=UPI00215B4A8E|nr:ABC transporter substrate-binding protein [Frigidibacter sp. ROC022]MCR8723480.1 ABC transporter substrate-binding protein [Frigidibacter sp. ROC022]
MKKTSLLMTALACVAFATQVEAKGQTILFATWRGCEEACHGVVDYLSETAPDAEVVILDADRNHDRLKGIVAEARSKDVDLIISWGTTVTLATAGTLSDLNDPSFNHEIPQVFMIVADPVGSGIIETLDDTGRGNLTGTYNRVPENVTVDTLRRILPDMKSLGLLYNPNEKNSILKRDELAELLPSLGVRLVDHAFELSEEGAPQIEDIAGQVKWLKQAGAEAIYVGSSSFLRANASIFGAAAKDAALPVISPYEEMVQNGDALISVAARYYDVGQLAGQQAAAILVDGKSAGSLPVARIKDFAITVNLDFSREIEIWPPIDLLGIADIVR